MSAAELGQTEKHNLHHGCVDNNLVNTNLQQLALRALCETFPSYRPGKCHLNALRILDHMEKECVDLGDVRVLAITSAASSYFRGLRTLWQRRHKSLRPQDWTFHVCLDVRGRIFDPDFIGLPGLKIPGYVETMFGRGARNLVARVHSVALYHEFYYDSVRVSDLTEWPADQILPLNHYAAERALECRHVPSLLMGAKRFTGIEHPDYTPPWWNLFVK